jgi:iron complex transport system substrate-binding protein
MDNQNSKIKVMLILNMQGTSPIVAGKGTSGDGFIKMTGALNVANNFEGWKPISSESIISYNPDFIIITNRGMGSFPDTKSLSETTALRFTDAAKEQNILSEDGMAMLGFGVRTIAAALEFAETFQQ